MNYKITGLAVGLALCLVPPAEAKRTSWEQRQLDGLSFRAHDFYHNDLERAQFKLGMKDAILNVITHCRRHVDGSPVRIHSCRTSPEGCSTRIGHFVNFFVEAAEAYDINPWILAAMAYNESRYNPFAEGPTVSSRGILQLNPRTWRGKASPFARNGRRAKKFRAKCRHEPGNCQREIVFKAADHIDSAVRHCGSLAGGLSMYNTGRCDVRRRYVRNTAKVWRLLQYRAGEKKIKWCSQPRKR